MSTMKTFLQFVGVGCALAIWAAIMIYLMDRAIFAPVVLNSENPVYSPTAIIEWAAWCILLLGVVGAYIFGEREK